MSAPTQHFMDWVDATPVVRETYPPYPVDAFRKVARKAILEVINRVQAPESIVAMTALAAMCAATQRRIDVELPTGIVCPVSLYLFGRLPSVEGKTSVVTPLLRSILARDERLLLEHAVAGAAYQREIRTWRVIEKGLARQMQKEVAAGRPYEDLETRYTAHLAKEPVAPRKRQTVRRNISQRALHEALEGDREAIAALADEGQTIISGGVLDRLEVVNGIWSGQLQSMDRGYGKSIVCRNPRLALLLLVPNGLADRYEREHGEEARLGGFMGRCLHAAPPSNIGFRVDHPVKDEQPITDFLKLIDEFFEESDRESEMGCFQHKTIRFSEEAADAWMAKRRELEEQMRPNGQLYETKVFAGRSLETAGRIAAIFHFSSKELGFISLDTFERAWRIVEWHLQEFKRIFYEGSAQRVLQRNVEALIAYFKKIGIGLDNFKKNEVLQRGPLRAKASLQPALDVLEQRGMVTVQTVGGVRVIVLDHLHFPNARPRQLFR